MELFVAEGVRTAGTVWIEYDALEAMQLIEKRGATTT